MKNKFLLFLLAICTATIQTNAYDFKAGNLCYNINNDGITVTVTSELSGGGYASLQGAVVIPENVSNGGVTYTVTAIGEDAFLGDEVSGSNLTSVTIPNTVTSIGDNAFMYCSNLTSIQIPVAVTTIGKFAFRQCSKITSLNIPRNVSTIGRRAFDGCSSLASITVDAGNAYFDSRNNCNAIIQKGSNILLAGCKNTIIPNSVTQLGERAFSFRQGLTSITIPNSVTVLGGGLFLGCTDLVSVNMPNSITEIPSNTFNECTSLESIVIPSTVKKIGEAAFQECSSLTSIIIPASVTSIDYYAFYECGLQQLTFNARNCDQFIFGQSPFASCPISELIIGDDAEIIPDYIMTGVTSLQKVTIGESVKSLGVKPFVGCTGLKEVNYNAIEYNHYDMGNKPTYIEDGETFINYLFDSQYCSLEKFTLGESVQYLPYGLLNGSMSEVHSLVIPDALKKIEYYSITAFDNLETLHIGAGLESLGGLPISYGIKQISISQNNNYMTMLDDVIYDKAVTELLYYPGYRTNPEYNTPPSLKYISYGIFWSHPYLRVLNLSSSIEELECFGGDDALIGLSGLGRDMGLESINVDAANEHYSSLDGVLFNADRTKLLVYPQSKADIYYVVPNGVKIIGGCSFRANKYLQYVTLPSSVKRIEAFAFQNSESLVYADLGGAEIIGRNSFAICKQLNNVVVSDCLHTIEYLAFSSSSLVSINLPETMRVIDDKAFSGCSNLQLSHLPDSLMIIGASAFNGCNNVTFTNVPQSLVLMGEKCFGTYSNSMIEWDNGVGYIGDFVYTCDGYPTYVSIRPGTRGIAGAAFRNKSNLQYIDIPESIESVEQNAFAGTAWLANQKPSDHVVYVGKVAYCHYGFDNGDYYYGELNIKEGTKGIGSDILKRPTSSGGLSKGKVSSVKLPSTLTNVASRAFDYDYNLSGKLELPEGLVCTGYSAFDTPLVSEVVWPSSMTAIGSCIFAGIGGKGEYGGHWSGTDGDKGDALLLKFHIHHIQPPQINLNIFFNAGWAQGYPFVGTLYVPRGSSKLYREHDVWGKFENIVEENVPGLSVPGDVNGDGACTASDVTALYNKILYNDESSIVNGDQNGDGVITASDVTAVYNIILGL